MALAAIEVNLEYNFTAYRAEVQRARELAFSDAFTLEGLEGAVTLATGRANDAVIHFLRAASVNPMDSYTQWSLAWALFSADRLGEAEPVLRHAIGLNSDSASVRSTLGEVLLARWLFDAALSEMQKATD